MMFMHIIRSQTEAYHTCLEDQTQHMRKATIVESVTVQWLTKLCKKTYTSECNM